MKLAADAILAIESTMKGAEDEMRMWT